GNSVELPRRRSTWCWKQGPSSLSDLKEIGCKSVWLVYISPLFRPIEQLLAFKIVKIYPHPVTFSLRFFKSDRLLAAWSSSLKVRFLGATRHKYSCPLTKKGERNVCPPLRQ